ncbi:MAG TPA: hypothetical protein VEJ84_13800, partial [Acidimicrobiales bacterium]|nr:hypothetical protein [Acidimicrobiales bacterium]
MASPYETLEPTPRAADRSARRWAGPFAATLVGMALFAAGCGGAGRSTAVAHVGTTASTTARATANRSAAGGSTYQQAVQYAQCMRKNGVPGFPGPNANGDFFFQDAPGGNGVNPNSPQFQAAQNACKSLAPAAPTAAQSNTFLAQAFKFSGCMRKNGVPNFPDPKES